MIEGNHNISSGDLMLKWFVKYITSDINFGIVITDHQAKIVEINHMACRVLGIKKECVLDRDLKDAFPGLPEKWNFIYQVLTENGSVRNKLISWSNQGSKYDLLVDSDFICDDQDHVLGRFTIFKDISHLKTLEQQIQRSERLAVIGQIAAGTAHEIRNPLTSIKGFLQILQQSLRDKNLQREMEYISIMKEELSRINLLVSEFLLLSKPKDIQFQEVDLNRVLQDILVIIKNEALLHGIDLVDVTGGKLPHIIGDVESLKQVFLNLCKNAIEAMNGNGSLSIDFQLLKGKKVSINFHDTGPGIPPYVMDKIFDPFFTTKENGTGLGLPICHRIIHDLGGNIRISTKGYGTTFHIVLPHI
ncbi:ATP-binding protein [Microaerobacter geothermalis]|nr:ATP-binding protein [Microaerobacter geothermalis]